MLSVGHIELYLKSHLVFNDTLGPVQMAQKYNMHREPLVEHLSQNFFYSESLHQVGLKGELEGKDSMGCSDMVVDHTR